MHNQPATNKQLGQHWLNDRNSLSAICKAANITDSDVVLEIGPGPGALTKMLIEQAGKVVAVEFDSVLAGLLKSKIKSPKLEVHNQDILKFNLTSLPKGYKVVANIPYYLTSKLVRVLSESANPASVVVLLIQKEVAQRLAAKPGEMSLLSVTAQYFWEVQLGIEVPAELFTPPPKVDSQVVVMHRRLNVSYKETKPLFLLIKAGFSSRRKTLLNSLSGGLRLDRDTVTKVLLKANIDQNRRPQTLSLEEWQALHATMQTLD